MYRIYNRESGWLIFQENKPRRATWQAFQLQRKLPQPHDFSEWRSTDRC